MKNLKISITVLALALLTSFTTTAKDFSPTKKSKEVLRTKIVSLIGKNIPLEINEETISTEISFILSDNNELVVLSVNSKNKSLDSYLKGKLNYKKITVKGIKKGEVYKMPLTIKQP